jgi:uncharacterized protein with FMN-binding domain
VRRALIALLGTVAGLAGLLGLKANLAPSTTTTAAELDAVPPAATAAAPAAPDGSDKQASAKTATGTLVSNPYESFQVRVTVADTTITKVEILQLATKDKRSQQVTAAALPKLQQATISANSADVDTVSGATFTTKSYQESLQSALDKAGL